MPVRICAWCSAASLPYTKLKKGRVHLLHIFPNCYVRTPLLFGGDAGPPLLRTSTWRPTSCRCCRYLLFYFQWSSSIFTWPTFPVEKVFWNNVQNCWQVVLCLDWKWLLLAEGFLASLSKLTWSSHLPPVMIMSCCGVPAGGCVPARLREWTPPSQAPSPLYRDIQGAAPWRAYFTTWPLSQSSLKVAISILLPVMDYVINNHNSLLLIFLNDNCLFIEPDIMLSTLLKEQLT